MTDVTSHEPGTPSWADLGTTDGKAAKEFYSNLFGWEAEDSPTDDQGGIYTIFKVDGKRVAALYEQGQEMREREVPPMWLTYVTVANADEAAQAAEKAGGKVHAQPFDVLESGRMALLQDPTGAMIAIWQAKEHPGAEKLHEPGALDWFELSTNDPDKAGEFYEQVFGWTRETQDLGTGPYVVCSRGDQPVAGIPPKESLPEGVPPNWSVCFQVDDCDATLEKAKEAGAEVQFGPVEIQGVGKFAVIKDPQGAHFTVLKAAATMEQPPGAEELEDEDKSGSGGQSSSDAEDKSGSGGQSGSDAEDKSSSGGQTGSDAEDKSGSDSQSSSDSKDNSGPVVEHAPAKPWEEEDSGENEDDPTESEGKDEDPGSAGAMADEGAGEQAQEAEHEQTEKEDQKPSNAEAGMRESGAKES
jgi:predicted enzyme related to lactoylglutathione lyase